VTITGAVGLLAILSTTDIPFRGTSASTVPLRGPYGVLGPEWHKGYLGAASPGARAFVTDQEHTWSVCMLSMGLRLSVDVERVRRWPLRRLYGTWPGGLSCALTVVPGRRRRWGMLLLEIWTLEGEHLVFHEHRADRDPCRS